MKNYLQEITNIVCVYAFLNHYVSKWATFTIQDSKANVMLPEVRQGYVDTIGFQYQEIFFLSEDIPAESDHLK